MTKKAKVENRALAIFIKNPQLGNAKTRIAKDSSDEKALDIYNKLLSITRNLTKEVDAKKYVFYNQFIDTEDDWDSKNFNKKLQSKGDLGVKMSDGFQLLFAEKFDKVLLIGSDCPYITPSVIEEGFNALDTSDFVFGPTYDGGYYLIGMKQFNPLVFSDIQWSTESVLETSINRIRSMGRTTSLLPKLKDIDHLSDWQEYKSKLN